MEISPIRSAFSFMFSNQEREKAEVTLKRASDIVDIHAPELLADEDVEGVLNETIDMIGNDGAAALSVHSGLTDSRVFALLGL